MWKFEGVSGWLEEVEEWELHESVLEVAGDSLSSVWQVPRAERLASAFGFCTRLWLCSAAAHCGPGVVSDCCAREKQKQKSGVESCWWYGYCGAYFQYITVLVACRLG